MCRQFNSAWDHLKSLMKIRLFLFSASQVKHFVKDSFVCVCYNDPMKKMVMIGSVVMQMDQYVKTLPQADQDIEVLRTETSIIGSACAFLKLYEKLSFPYVLLSTVGTGMYAEPVREYLAEREFIESEAVEGAVMTLHDARGSSSSFLLDGAQFEFHYHDAQILDPEDTAGLVIGADILAFSSDDVLDTVQDLEKPVWFFFDGLAQPSSDQLEELLEMKPTVICSQAELAEYDLDAQTVYDYTGKPVIVLNDGEGAYCFEGGDSYIASCEHAMEPGMFTAAYAAAVSAGVDGRNALVFAVEACGDGQESLKKRLAGMILHR